METFNRYFDRIHADENLKIKVKEVISMKENTDVKAAAVKRGGRFSLAIGLAAVFAVVFAVGYIYYQKPVSYVSLDINPSVELELNFLDRVIGTTAENADGEALLAGLRVRNLSVDSAISYLVQNAYEKGYVKKDGSTVISLTAISDDQKKVTELQVKTKNGAAEAMQAKKAFATVYQSASDMAFRNEAKEAGVSPGKYKLIKSLEVLDPEIDIGQYKDAKVSEIMAKAQEIVQQKYAAGEDFGNKDLEEIVEKVKKAGEDIAESKEQAAKQEKEQEAEQNQNSGTSQNQEQESNANQNGSAQASGEQNQNSFAGSNAASQTESQFGSQAESGNAGSNASQGNASQGNASQDSDSQGNASQAQQSEAGSQGNSGAAGSSGGASVQSGGGGK